MERIRHISSPSFQTTADPVVCCPRRNIAPTRSTNNKSRASHYNKESLINCLLGCLCLFVLAFAFPYDVQHYVPVDTKYTKEDIQIQRASENTGLNLPQLNQYYSAHNNAGDTDAILDWICSEAQKGKKIVQLTNFGPSSLVILHKLHTKGISCRSLIPVITMDTLHLFPENYEFIQSEIDRDDGYQLHIMKPANFSTQKEFDSQFGVDLYRTNPEKYAYLTKIEPTQLALDSFHTDAWITGRRKSQRGDRTSLQAFELDEGGRRIKINPLVDWSYDQVWDYIRQNNLPYNPLYDQGYKSLGDVQMTVTVAANADERSGRFQGLNQTECGMHNLEHVGEFQADAEFEDSSTGKNMEEEEHLFSPKDYFELTSRTFQKLVLDEDALDLFLVYYHPKCSHCRRFEPTFFEIAKELKPLKHIQAARHNVQHGVPSSAKNVGLRAPGTPVLYLVQHTPWRVTKYEGLRGKDATMGWLKRNGALD
jgi:phosphoadenosine phosphosulfate reductase